MPELAEQMYCSEQITIPPPFPYLLRQYAKAAIRTQPTDLLKWSTAYFRCLSLNIPPPVKPRLEYPVPRDYYGVTPGWLKALLYQLQNNQTISFQVLWDRWTGACLQHSTLIQILCLGGFDNPDAIPWLRFVGLCAAHLTEDLTHSMNLICEIMTEEPEGGSAMIPLEIFMDLYKFLAKIDASKPQKIKNMYFTDSLLSLWRDKIEKDEQPKEVKEESITEEESVKSQLSETATPEEFVREPSKEEISCPSLAADDQYSVEYYIDAAVKEEPVESNQVGYLPDYLQTEDETSYNYQMEEEDDVRVDAEDYDSKEVKVEESEEKLEEATASKDAFGINDDELTYFNKETVTKEEDTEIDLKEEPTIEPEVYESVDTIIEEPRQIEPEYFEDERILQEDLQKLKALQEIPGETDEEVEKFKCRLIEEMPLTDSQLIAVDHYKDSIPAKKEYTPPIQDQEKEEDPDEGKICYEEVFINPIPGIGPQVPQNLVDAVAAYMKSVSVIQHGMIMPRNVRHYNCPPLESLEY